jgi:glycosyltransferase involved in cell wall biosynthesis
MPTIDILLGTYNGAKYLPELLQSLERQTYRDWRLIVRDDGSTDETLTIVKTWAQTQRQPVEFASDGRGHLGPCGNFAALLTASDAPYFMFCDQDDAWLPHKLARLLELIRSVEARQRADLPIMAHSDLTVVDSQLRSIHPSFNRYSRIGTSSPERLWRLIMASNVVIGCASIGNAALRRMALPIPPEAAMHEWWAALVAARFGEIAYLAEPTVLYRQHGLNAVGATSWSLPSIFMRLLRAPRLHLDKAESQIRRSQIQATAFASRFAGSLDEDTLALLHGYGNLAGKPIWHRKAFLLRNRIRGRNRVYSAMLLMLG